MKRTKHYEQLSDEESLFLAFPFSVPRISMHYSMHLEAKMKLQPS